MINVGDKVLLTQTRTFAIVLKIVNERGDGTETEVEEETAAICLFLESDHGPCKVYLHDKDRFWHAYAELN